MKTLDFTVEVIGDWVHCDADGEIRRSAQSFAGPISALIEAIQNFYQAYGIDFVDATGFRIITNGWRVAGDGEHVAHTANGPRAEKHGLQADDVVIARGEV